MSVCVIECACKCSCVGVFFMAFIRKNYNYRKSDTLFTMYYFRMIPSSMMSVLFDQKYFLTEKSVQEPAQTIIIDTINVLLFTRQDYVDPKLDFGYTLQASQQIVKNSRSNLISTSYVCGVVRNSVTVLHSRKRIQSPYISSLYTVDTVVHQNL